MSVKLYYAQLATRIDGYGKQQTVLRGVLSPETMIALQIDWYQRQAHQPGNLAKIVKGFREGSAFQDVALGMRGDNFIAHADDVVELLDPTYIVDGFHRVTGGIILLQDRETPFPPERICLGATVFFNTTAEMERDWFTVWNTTRKAVAPSVIIRNEKEKSAIAATLYGLSVNDESFACYGRVAWDDRVLANQIIRGATLLKLSHALHMHKFGRGVTGGGCVVLLARLDARIDKLGLPHLRKNLVTFMNVVDSCWGLRDESARRSRLHMRESFLLMLARLFSDHEVFWKNAQRDLHVSESIKHDLRRIDLNDDEISRLIRGGNSHGTSMEILYQHIVQRLNRGKSTHRLVARVEKNGDEEEAAA